MIYQVENIYKEEYEGESFITGKGRDFGMIPNIRGNFMNILILINSA